MTYKTILVHLNDERRVGSLIDAACHLGERFNAHVIALYVMPPVPTYGSTAFGAGMIQSGLKTFREEAERVHKSFEDASRGRGIVPEWRRVDPVRKGLAETIIEHGRCADLIIVGQRDSDFDFSGVLDVPERIVIESGRPVLVVPKVGRFKSIGKRVTVAWNSRREATRAVFDALPLLVTADRVRVVWINPQKEPQAAGDLPSAEIAATLARHGVNCEAATATGADMSVGDVLLSGLTDDSSDLLVMGAWGHSRMRELMFGGATRKIFEHMTVPVLMSH